MLIEEYKHIRQGRCVPNSEVRKTINSIHPVRHIEKISEEIKTWKMDDYSTDEKEFVKKIVDKGLSGFFINELSSDSNRKKWMKLKEYYGRGKTKNRCEGIDEICESIFCRGLSDNAELIDKEEKLAYQRFVNYFM